MTDDVGSTDREPMPRAYDAGAAALRLGAADPVQAVRSWVGELAVSAGLGPDSLEVGRRLVAGHFYRRRAWNCVASVAGRDFAAIHCVSLRAAAGRDPRVTAAADEMLGRALDASKAVSGARLRPWLGYVFVLDDSPYWRQGWPSNDSTSTDAPETPASQASRFRLFVERVVASRLLDAGCVVEATDLVSGVEAAVSSVSVRSFAAGFTGRCLAFRTVEGGTP